MSCSFSELVVAADKRFFGVNRAFGETENNIIFEVTNFGHHIKPEVQEQLFKKYVSKSKKYNNIGTGLGLYIAKKIITAHNGQMIVKSNIDGRNSFGFILPAKQQPQVLESLTQN